MGQIAAESGMTTLLVSSERQSSQTSSPLQEDVPTMTLDATSPRLRHASIPEQELDSMDIDVSTLAPKSLQV